MTLLSPAEMKLAQRLSFPIAACELLKKAVGKTEILEQAARYDFVAFSNDMQEFLIEGVCIALPHGEARRCVEEVQAEMLLLGCRAFVGEKQPIPERNSTYTLAAIQTTADREIIRTVGTRARNYDLTTQDIVDRLDSWTAQGGKFTVVGAGRDWIEFDIEAVPGGDVCAFAVQVYLFCPDSVDQGVGSTREEDAPEFFAAARALCPGEPPGLRQATAGWWDSDPEDDWEVSEDFVKEAYLESEIGVKLLATYLHETRPIFLWWD